MGWLRCFVMTKLPGRLRRIRQDSTSKRVRSPATSSASLSPGKGDVRTRLTPSACSCSTRVHISSSAAGATCGQFDLGWVAPDQFALGPHCVERRLEFAQTSAAREEPVAEACGTFAGAGGVAADDDRDRAVDRRRLGDAVVERRIGVVHAGLVLGPQGAHRLDVVIVPGATVGKGHAERIEFFLEPPDADAEHHSPAAQRVECGDLFGDAKPAASARLARSRAPAGVEPIPVLANISPNFMAED